MAIDINECLKAIQERKFFQPIGRYRKEVNIDECLQLVQAIGQSRKMSFVIDNENRFTYENFIKWLAGDPTMKALNPETREVIAGDFFKGVYIAGGTGTGKSWCMEIMKAFASVMKFNIKFGEEQGQMYWEVARADDIVSHFMETTSIEKYKQSKILCIQDLGAEPLEAVAMGNRMNVLRTLLEHRGDNSECLTLITSNLPLGHKKLDEAYDKRVSSRLYQMCNYFEIKGKDRRK